MDITPRLKEHFSRHSLFYFVLAATFAFGLAAHAYRFLNLDFHHDSLEILEDAAWQIGLGRFMQPVYWKLRGDLTPPWLLGLLFLLWMSIGNYLVMRLLRFRSLTFVALLCAVLTTNLTISLSAASYLSWLDVYGLAYLLAVGAACVTVRYRRGFLLAWPLLLLSLHLYQGYFNVAVILLMIVFVRDALDGRDGKDLFLRAVKYVAALFGGVFLYYLSLLVAQSLFGITLTDAYNGVSDILSRKDFLSAEIFIQTCAELLNFLLYPPTPLSKAVLLVNLILGALAVWGIVCTARDRRMKAPAMLLMVLCILLMPLGVNLTCLASSGVSTNLTRYAFYFYYVFTALMLEYGLSLKKPWVPLAKLWRGRWRVLLRACAVCLLTATVFSQIVHANQIYLRQALEWESSLSIATRITYDIEKTEGYVPGQTPVLFLGTLRDSALTRSREGFEHIMGTWVGYTSYIFTYNRTYDFFFRHVLAYNIQIVNLSSPEGEKISASPEVAAMPAYPAEGSCKIVDGVLVVKLSN